MSGQSRSDSALSTPSAILASALCPPSPNPQSPRSSPPTCPTRPRTLIPKLSLYLDLLLKWNARTNLTAIRDPEEIVRRHFGESLFTAAHLPAAQTLLDFGSGAGFPGLPIALFLPQLRVTLAESQNKKVHLSPRSSSHPPSLHRSLAKPCRGHAPRPAFRYRRHARSRQHPGRPSRSHRPN